MHQKKLEQIQKEKRREQKQEYFGGRRQELLEDNCLICLRELAMHIEEQISQYKEKLQECVNEKKQKVEFIRCRQLYLQKIQQQQEIYLLVQKSTRFWNKLNQAEISYLKLRIEIKTIQCENISLDNMAIQEELKKLKEFKRDEASKGMDLENRIGILQSQNKMSNKMVDQLEQKLEQILEEKTKSRLRMDQ